MYLDAIKKQNESYPVNYYDMFPYADNTNDYWTGYFTSRANSKRQIRDASANIHASNKLFARKMLNQSSTDDEISEIL
jgi:alpha-mannosidase